MVAVFSRISRKNAKFVIFSVVLVILAIGSVKRTYVALTNSQRLDDLRAEVAGLKEEKAALEEEITFKQSDYYAEERARNDLNMVRPEEDVFVIPPEKPRNIRKRALSLNLDAQGILNLDFEDESEGEVANVVLWLRLFF